MKYPLVSIAVATYNGDKFLRKQIDSLLSQDYPNLEIVISDDCSNDGTWEILQYYSQQDKRIRLLPQEQNVGYVRNFMRVFLACNGSFIAPCDQDDIWYNNKITLLVSKINNAELIYSNNELIDLNDKKICCEENRPMARYFSGSDIRSLIFCNTISGHTMLFRKHLVDKVFDVDAIVFIDWMLAFLAASNGEVIYVDDVLVKWRQHHSSFTFNLRKNSKEAREIAIKQTNAMLHMFSKVPNEHQRFIIKVLSAWSDWLNSHFSLKLFLIVVRYSGVTHRCSLVRFPALKYLLGYKLKKKLRPKYY